MAPRRKKTTYPGRPWMLGTDEIPPPMRVPFQMWSKSSDPHQGGLIQFEFTDEGLAVKWFGDFDASGGVVRDGKSIIEWHELTWVAGQKPLSLTEEIVWIKEQAAHDAYVRVVREWLDRVGSSPQSEATRALVERCCRALENPPKPPPSSPTE